MEEATFRYRVIQAVVGKKRCDELEEQIRNKVMSRMAGGAGELLKCFKLFSSGKGEIGPTQLMSVVQVPLLIHLVTGSGSNSSRVSLSITTSRCSIYRMS